MLTKTLAEFMNQGSADFDYTRLYGLVSDLNAGKNLLSLDGQQNFYLQVIDVLRPRLHYFREWEQQIAILKLLPKNTSAGAFEIIKKQIDKLTEQNDKVKDESAKDYNFYAFIAPAIRSLPE